MNFVFLALGLFIERTTPKPRPVPDPDPDGRQGLQHVVHGR
jgi:hypothetical protein